MLLRRGPPLMGLQRRRLNSLEFGKDPTTNFRLPEIMHQKDNCFFQKINAINFFVV
jgi:hypothetical protein